MVRHREVENLSSLFEKIYFVCLAKFCSQTPIVRRSLCTEEHEVVPVRIDNFLEQFLDTEEVGTRLSTISAEDEVLQLEDLNISGREREIITEKRTFWKLTHEHLHLMPETNTLFTDSCYVVKWEYRHQKMGKFCVILLSERREKYALVI